MAIALAALSVPALAINPVIPATDATESATVATLAPLEAVAPVDLASPDNAPLRAQIMALQDRLYADGREGIVIVLQAMDAAVSLNSPARPMVM